MIRRRNSKVSRGREKYKKAIDQDNFSTERFPRIEKELSNFLQPLKIGLSSLPISVSEDYIKLDSKVQGTTHFENIKVDHSIICAEDNDLNIDFGGDELFFNNKGERVVTLKHLSATIPSVTVHGANGSLEDFFTILCSTNGQTTLQTTDDDGAEADFIINADGYLKLTSATGEDITLDSAGEVHLDAANFDAGQGVVIMQGGTRMADFTYHHNATYFTIYENGGASTDDWFGIFVEANGETTLRTTDGAGEDADLTIDTDGDIILDPSTGTLMLKSAGTDVGKLTPYHYHKWGGQMGRNTVGVGYHLGVPSGFDSTQFNGGNGTDPYTSYIVSNTADHANNVVQDFHDAITVVSVYATFGEGASSNTTHNFHLMRYDIDADGDWSNGTVVATGTDSNSDDWSQRRKLTLTNSGTSADLNVSTSQILVGYVEQVDASNTYMSCKYNLKYILQ